MIVEITDVDALAQIIRRVDGSNKLGAGALAEAIIAALEPQDAPAVAAERAALVERLGNVRFDGLELDCWAAAAEITRLSAEVERLKGQDWQPIETAPTDGTLCLWWDDSSRAVRIGRFRDGYFFWGGLLEARSAIPRKPTDTGFTHWRLPPRPPLAEPPH